MTKENEIFTSILARLKEQGFSQVEGYVKFKYKSDSLVLINLIREKGKMVSINKDELKDIISEYLKSPELFDQGPSSLRAFGITYVTSPMWSLLHLVPKSSYYDN